MRQFLVLRGASYAAMILTCPSCSTRYQADSARFAPPGRNVRCAKCSHIWFQPAPGPEVEPEPERTVALQDSPPAPELAQSDNVSSGAVSAGLYARPMAEDVQASYRYERPSFGVRLAQTTGWVALFLIVAGIGWASVQYRQAIATVWPQSASIYAAMGLPVNVRGIALVDISYQQNVEEGQQVLSVSGKVVNISDKELPVPVIRVVLSDEAKRELYHWTFDVGVPTLKPGAESPFVTRLSSPPPDARNVNIRFAEAGDAQ